MEPEKRLFLVMYECREYIVQVYFIFGCVWEEKGAASPPPPRDPNIVYCKTCYLFSIFYTRAEKVAEKCYAATPQMREYCTAVL